MGRYTTLKIHNEDIEIKCSGLLENSIYKIISVIRFQDSWFNLTKQEVLLVMEDMKNGMCTVCNLNYQVILAREKGYRIIGYLMMWYHDAKDTDTLEFG